MKVHLYARVGIREAWVVDLEREVVEIYLQPSPQGYQEVRSARRGEVVSPELFPELRLAVDEILP